MTLLEKIIGLIIGFAGVVTAAVRFRTWWKKTAEARRIKTVRYQLQLLCEGQVDIDDKLKIMDDARAATKKTDDEMHLTIAENLVRAIKKTDEMHRHIAEDLLMATRHTETLNSVVLGKLDEINADVRLSVSATAVALDGLVQLGKESNVIVNGPVGKMREKLNDRIIEGIGAPRPEKKGA